MAHARGNFVDVQRPVAQSLDRLAGQCRQQVRRGGIVCPHYEFTVPFAPVQPPLQRPAPQFGADVARLQAIVDLSHAVILPMLPRDSRRRVSNAACLAALPSPSDAKETGPFGLAFMVP